MALYDLHRDPISSMGLGIKLMRGRIGPGCPPKRDRTKSAQNDLRMPFKAILHAERTAKVTLTAHNAGQATFKFPQPVRARAATSPLPV
eukprot:661463-Pleurochrysis_carterae.AAC.5